MTEKVGFSPPSSISEAIEMEVDTRTRERLNALMEVNRLDFSAMTLAAGLDPATSFRGADLRGVDFGESVLAGFDFTGADMAGCDLSRAKTEGAKGLDFATVLALKIFSYTLVRDYGFSPNPFHGVCTLATCKPEIRATATPGDWVVGIGSVQENLGGRLIYAMEVAEAISFDEYWSDPRFHSKRPYLPGSKKMRYGDNIYHHDQNGHWVQEDSHHSLAGGVSNPLNLDRDTSTDRVLIGLKYYYFGSACPEVPSQFEDISRSRRGYKCNFPKGLVQDFLAWLQGTYQCGWHGLPVNW